ncbi:MAG: non-canonical purine NTP pyrophosphatase [Anaerolineae bacterium]|nr:non-canonical purine NTP pyrophosphatase [Anaerolineae bacterium]
MPESTLYFVSSNEEKYREIRGALESCPVSVERIALDLPEIQSTDPAEVARFKAQAAYDHIGEGRVLVEDTGLGVVAWNGYPGALIKWVLGAIGEDGLCRQLHAWDDRHAIATVILCLSDGRTTQTFAGQVNGEIARSPRGNYGFGWDSIFVPEGHTVTYGEMQREAKMKISMRARALDKLRDFLINT